jgi:copper chaperone
MTQVTLNVPDISCAHCEKTIVEALRGKEGVQAVAVSVPSKHVLLKYDESKIALEQVKEILDEEGYPVSSTQS